jgi:hypothetical protein
MLDYDKTWRVAKLTEANIHEASTLQDNVEEEFMTANVDEDALAVFAFANYISEGDENDDGSKNGSLFVQYDKCSILSAKPICGDNLVLKNTSNNFDLKIGVIGTTDWDIELNGSYFIHKTFVTNPHDFYVVVGIPPGVYETLEATIIGYFTHNEMLSFAKECCIHETVDIYQVAFDSQITYDPSLILAASDLKISK